MNTPADLKYTSTHEWIRFDNDKTATVGITDHAQSLLGDVVFIDLPQKNREVSVGQDCCVVESVKAASDIYAPVSGKIVEVNQKLSESPDLINRDPYGEGWIFRMQINSADADNLLDSQTYAQSVANEAH